MKTRNNESEKFLLTIEFRYGDAPKSGEESSQYISKTVTLGVFDTRDEANLSGNKALEIFENHFELNPNYNRKKRFSISGGCFGYPHDLITNLGYISTPFDFYAKITTLKYGSIEENILNAIAATKRHRAYKAAEKD